MIGLAGSDTLTGGAGADTINGGAGADVFKYDFWQDSETAHRDQIIGFTGPGVAAGDRIDLSGAYPFTLTFVGTAAFSGVGQVRVVNAGTNTFVQVDIGPAPGAEMEIVMRAVARAGVLLPVGPEEATVSRFITSSPKRGGQVRFAF